MKYAFYISGRSGRVIQFLKQATQCQINNIKCVISDFPVEDETRKIIEGCKIDCICFDRRNGGSSNKEKNLFFSNKMLSVLTEKKIDYCFSFGSHILCGELLDVYENRIINFHPAILPMFPGLYALDQALDCENTFLVGNTAHFIDKGVDSGPVIMQSVMPIKDFRDTVDYSSVLDVQIEMLNRLILIIDNNRLEVINNTVNIIGANYQKWNIYPDLGSI